MITLRQKTELQERLELLQEEIRLETERLVSSEFVNGKTSMICILRIALENIASNIIVNEDQKNHLKILDVLSNSKV